MRAPFVMWIPLAILLMAAATPPQPLAAAIPPGPAHDAILRLLRPYAEATNTALASLAWDGSADALQKLLTARQADLLLLSGPDLAGLCHAGSLAKLDWPTLSRDRFLPNITTDCGAPAYIAATVLAWDTDKLAGAPPGWADFWDIAKHPGRRGLHRAARFNLEIALLADGVSQADIYRTLRSPDGVDRAFRKLDQLKPYIVWWDQPAQPAQLLASAKVLLTTAPSSTLPGGGKTRVGIQWTNSLAEAASWAVPAAALHPRAAAAALAIATDAARLALFARATNLGPPTRAALALLPPEAIAQNPGLPANQQAALFVDDGFWAENSEKLEARFAAWLAR